MSVVICNLGAIIKSARERKGLTQQELAERVECSIRHIQGIENEGSNLGFDILYRIIRELIIPADSIFYPEMTAAETHVEYASHLLLKCEKRDIRAVIALLEALARNTEDR